MPNWCRMRNGWEWWVSVAGRPKLPIDENQVEKLGRLGCTVEEIAEFFSCSTRTITDRFSQALTRARAAERISIRRARTIRAIKDRSDTMLIYLSKVRLGENDKSKSQDGIEDSQVADDNGDPIKP